MRRSLRHTGREADVAVQIQRPPGRTVDAVDNDDLVLNFRISSLRHGASPSISVNQAA
jgi:hypothetical protein